MKKVLLLNPPPITSKNYFKDVISGGRSYANMITLPLNLAYVASFLRENGVTVDLLDANALNYTLKDLKRYLLTYEPNIVVLNVVDSSVISDIKIAKFIKKVNPNIKIVCFGNVPTSYLQILLKEDIYDFFIAGESELTSLELINNLSSDTKNFKKINGLIWKKNNRIIKNKPRNYIKNLDILPFPARDLLPLKKYKNPLGKSDYYTHMRTSRGCLYNCLFCGTRSQGMGKWRAQTPKRVVDEIQEIKQKYGIRDIWFYDEQPLLDKRRAIEICKEIIKRKLDVEFLLMARVNQVDKTILKYLSKAGCYRIDYGVESADERILRTIRKGTTISQVRRAFRLTKEAGIGAGALLIIGLPGETWKTIKKTENFIKEIDADLAIYKIATPFPGTDFYEMAKKNNWLINDDLERYDMCDFIVSYPDFTANDIKKAQKWVYNDFYLRPHYLYKQLKKIRSLRDFKLLIRNFYNYSVFMKNTLYS